MTRDDLDRVIVSEALSWLGTPYRHQASARGQGTDCLGLVRGVWRYLHGAEPQPVPPYLPHWDRGEGDELLLDAAHRYLIPCDADRVRAGEVVVFRMVPGAPAKHCGIMISESAFVHAYAGRQVVRSRWTPFWSSRLAARFCFPLTEGEAS
ncbi:NlpC/P60 family protein [Parvularcula sp. LCG005]|uniref:NlpC/P60 family protein n=1 Tax=Parvularcula sp. LCG005 TaxID=3078805 RepID=UPI0029422597|nr:NlpC/P60 family protein [Parvularcula sp. LCG005]WOI54001.1 NlpC/P60 family protein [Parvularcula sp. LCG005]